jgi:hypothetical protein
MIEQLQEHPDVVALSPKAGDWLGVSIDLLQAAHEQLADLIAHLSTTPLDRQAAAQAILAYSHTHEAAMQGLLSYGRVCDCEGSA